MSHISLFSSISVAPMYKKDKKLNTIVHEFQNYFQFLSSVFSVFSVFCILYFDTPVAKFKIKNNCEWSWYVF